MPRVRKRTIIITIAAALALIAVIIFALHYYITRAPLYEQDAYLLRFEYRLGEFNAYYLLRQPAENDEELLAQIGTFIDENDIIYKLRNEIKITEIDGILKIVRTLAMLGGEDVGDEHPSQDDTDDGWINVYFLVPGKSLRYGQYLENSYKLGDTGYSLVKLANLYSKIVAAVYVYPEDNTFADCTSHIMFPLHRETEGKEETQ